MLAFCCDELMQFIKKKQKKNNSNIEMKKQNTQNTFTPFLGFYAAGFRTQLE